MILLTVVAVVAMLILAEAAIRVRQTIRYGTAATMEEYYTTDPRIGLRVPIANMAKGHISINSLGFRGPEIAVPKAPGDIRIAFLGSSTTWCAEVSGNEYVWSHLVTASIATALPGHQFDYINGGVPGYTVASSLKNLQLRISPLQPDIVVIYEGINDLTGELRDVAVQHGVITEAKVQQLSWPARYSVLWNLVEKNLRVLASQRAAQQDRARLTMDTSTLGVQYRKDLTELVRAAQQNAKLVAVATLATHVRREQSPEQQVTALSSAIFFMPFITAIGEIESFAKYNQIIREVARDTGALLIEGENTIPGDSAHFTDSVHFTDAGSRAMAERVSRVLIPRIVEQGNLLRAAAVR